MTKDEEIASLRKTVDYWQKKATVQRQHDEIERLRSQRTEFDCRYTMGDVADLSGSHCSIDAPCMRCRNERLRSLNAELVAALDALLSHANDTILRGWRDDEVFENARTTLAKVKEKT